MNQAGQIKKLQAQVKALSYDSAFGMLTRPAAFLRFKELIKDRRNAQLLYVVFIDLDQVHNLNKVLTQKVVDRKVRKAFQVRSTDMLFKARYKSGDELIAVIKGNPEGFAQRLQASIQAQGLSATIVYSKAGRNLAKTCERLSDLASEIKSANGRNTTRLA